MSRYVSLTKVHVVIFSASGKCEHRSCSLLPEVPKAQFVGVSGLSLSSDWASSFRINRRVVCLLTKPWPNMHVTKATLLMVSFLVGCVAIRDCLSVGTGPRRVLYRCHIGGNFRPVRVDITECTERGKIESPCMFLVFFLRQANQ